MQLAGETNVRRTIGSAEACILDYPALCVRLRSEEAVDVGAALFSLLLEVGALREREERGREGVCVCEREGEGGGRERQRERERESTRQKPTLL